jgi:hypothetical protein
MTFEQYWRESWGYNKVLHKHLYEDYQQVWKDAQAQQEMPCYIALNDVIADLKLRASLTDEPDLLAISDSVYLKARKALGEVDDF